MKFAIIQPAFKRSTIVDVEDARIATIMAGLEPGDTDHGTLAPGLGYVVGQYAMFDPPDRQKYFAIDRILVAGNALLYSVDSKGRTIDFGSLTAAHVRPRWFDSLDEIERAIAAGMINRPIMRIPHEPPFWQWPQPKPDMAEWQRRVNALMANGPITIDDVTIIPLDKESDK